MHQGFPACTLGMLRHILLCKFEKLLVVVRDQGIAPELKKCFILVAVGSNLVLSFWSSKKGLDCFSYLRKGECYGSEFERRIGRLGWDHLRCSWRVVGGIPPGGSAGASSRYLGYCGRCTAWCARGWRANEDGRWRPGSSATDRDRRSLNLHNGCPHNLRGRFTYTWTGGLCRTSQTGAVGLRGQLATITKTTLTRRNHIGNRNYTKFEGEGSHEIR